MKLTDPRINVRPSAATSSARDPLLLEKYKRLAHVRLQRPLTRLFFELTGLQLLVAWAPPPQLTWGSVLPFCKAARCKRICCNAPNRVRCQRFEKESFNIVAHEKLEASLRQALHKTLPFVAVSPATPVDESHGERIVHRMLDYIHPHYSQTIGLGMLAKQSGMNLAHLSSLFSKTVGLSFRSYLKQLRLEKAEALLSNPFRRISETAYAVGYSRVTSSAVGLIRTHRGPSRNEWTCASGFVTPEA